ncbi:MAG: SMP-30/gluconolactonase/LRE family protein, partial [Pacificimonas sp.]
AGGIERRDAALDALVAVDARIEALGTGYGWSEGPVWVDDAAVAGGGYLLFSDVPGNAIHRWDREGGARVWMRPSGHDGPDDAEFGTDGTNGLKPGLTPGTILAADHGRRGLFSINLETQAKTALTERFAGERYNSPNDVVAAADGALYFTDPPYGLKGGDESPRKAQPVNGVYRLAADGGVTLVEGGLSRPNGVALSPDGRTLYVANSDPERAIWMAYDVAADGTLSGGRVFFDATAMVGAAEPGLPDGLAVDVDGNLFATGPGGVLVFSPEARLLGRIRTGGPVANVAFGGPERDWLYLTANDRLVRVRTGTRGLY